MQQSSKIFGIGLSKTGTTSIFTALHMLGYRSGTYRHMARLGLDEWFFGNFEPDYLSDYDAMTDIPLAAFFPALDQRYPGSRFILTLRDQGDWLDSCQRHWGMLSREHLTNPFAERSILATYGLQSFEPSRFAYVHSAHEHNVRRYFADRADTLLVLDLFAGDGWEKLCHFLGIDSPQGSFPNVKPGHIPQGMKE